MSWQKIWSSRRIDNFNELIVNHDDILRNLLLLDGFDSPTGNIMTSSWNSFIKRLMEELSINYNDSIYEVGCGGGAFLYPFYKKGLKVGGIDYSNSLIEICNKTMPKMNFDVCQASDLNTESKFDFVSAFSVFFYFKDYDYASEVLEKMYNKSKKGILIFDIPDIDKKNECEIFRMGSMEINEYNQKYKDLKHLYYPRSFFENFAKLKKASFSIIEDQNIDEYCNNRFRFNFKMLK
jgi:ubiquinone/menaquinone biosynthesis C-methylase UbiE